jgi:hypothetical protein
MQQARQAEHALSRRPGVDARWAHLVVFHGLHERAGVRRLLISGAPKFHSPLDAASGQHGEAGVCLPVRPLRQCCEPESAGSQLGSPTGQRWGMAASGSADLHCVYHVLVRGQCGHRTAGVCSIYPHAPIIAACSAPPPQPCTCMDLQATACSTAFNVGATGLR